MERVAFLGTGLLGSGMVERALALGTPLTVWNRTASKAHALEARGAAVADAPERAVAGAARVHLVLQDDAAVDGVLERIAPALAPDAVVVDHSTTSPAGTKVRAARARARGMRFVHAPEFMSPQMAREGTSGPLVALPSIAKRMDDVIAAGHGGDDLAALAAPVLTAAGAKRAAG